MYGMVTFIGLNPTHSPLPQSGFGYHRMYADIGDQRSRLVGKILTNPIHPDLTLNWLSAELAVGGTRRRNHHGRLIE